MYDSGVKPLTGGRSRWIYHKLWVMGRLLEWYGLYMGHFKDYMTLAKNSAACASENWKNWQMQSLLSSAFITDVLAAAKNSAC